MHGYALAMEYIDNRPAKRARNSTVSEGSASAPIDSPPTPLAADGHVDYRDALGTMSYSRNEQDSSVPSTSAIPTIVGNNTSAGSSRASRETGTATLYRKEARSSKTLSCNECRRLKLKCDRVFPCQSCCKRGCAEICPDGALTSGKGSRFILANTEQLHEKIKQLSDRVRQLEEALETLQAHFSPNQHPLLAPDLLKIKSTFEVGGKGIPTGIDLSTSPVKDISKGQDQEETPLLPNQHRSSAEQMYSPKEDATDATETRSRASSPEVPQDLLQLSATFPVPWSIDLKRRKRIRDSLPSLPEATAICQEARRNALWQFNLDSSNTFLDNLLTHVYSTPIEELSPRRLALLLMNLAIGSVVSENEPIGSPVGEAYHHLARASICEIPLTEAPDFDLVHTLFYMIWYHLIFSDNKNAVTYAWNLMGFVAKLSQGLGLHRDASRAKVIPEEDEKRRAVFWELVYLDTRLSLSLGRPPSLYLTHIDAKPPVCPPTPYPDGNLYYDWKAKFLVHCLDPILQIIIQVDPPLYRQVVKLDTLVRDFRTPQVLAGIVRPTRFLVMQNAAAVAGIEIALLQLHRRYFLKALSSGEEFSLEHEYAPSVLATYLSACSLISSTEELFNAEPDISARFLHFWFNIFSVGVALSLITIRSPSSSLSPYALQALTRVCHLFRQVAKRLPFCAKAIPVLEKLTDKSCRAYNRWLEQNQRQLDLPSGRETPARISLHFSDAHPKLRHWVETISLQSQGFPQQSRPQDLSSPPLPKDEENRRLECLPDVYSFNLLGLGTGDRYSVRNEDFAEPHSHPFAPSIPRVTEDESLNLESGALTLDLTDTSYMAWF